MEFDVLHKDIAIHQPSSHDKFGECIQLLVELRDNLARDIIV